MAQSTAAVGALQGFVTDPQGGPLAGARVGYRRVTQYVRVGNSVSPAAGEAFVNGQITADTTGAFATAGLMPGNYALCANVPSAPYIDPCVWGQAVRVTVSAATTASQNIVLEKGVFLNVRLNDPVGLLPRAGGTVWTPPKALVGVTYANGAYQGAQSTSGDSAGRNYQLIVPVGTPFKLRLFSRDVALADSVGNALDSSGSQIPFQATADQDQAFTFTVTGPLKVQ